MFQCFVAFNVLLALISFVFDFRSSLKSPFAVCQLIRIACKLIEEEDSSATETGPYFDFVESWYGIGQVFKSFVWGSAPWSSRHSAKETETVGSNSGHGKFVLSFFSSSSYEHSISLTDGDSSTIR